MTGTIRGSKITPPLPQRQAPKHTVNHLALTGVDKVKAQFNLNGKGVTVAVLDSGFKYPGVKPEIWKDLGDGSPDPADFHDHGTHVIGEIKEIAPKAQIAAIRVIKDGKVDLSAILKGINWAIKNQEKYNIKVMNLSLSGPAELIPYGSGELKENLTGLIHPPYFYRADQPIRNAVNQALEAGITVVNAAGKEGPKHYTVNSPGDLPGVISVGAARDKNRMNPLSSRGPSIEGLNKPDLAAPGYEIHAWKASSEEPEWGIYTGATNATAQVSGIAALMLEADPQLTPQELGNILRETADPMPRAHPSAQGAGMVNAAAAIEKLKQKNKH